MVTDVILAVGAYWKIWELKMAKAARIKVIGLFGTRVLVSLVAIGQIVTVGKSLHSVDQIWASLDLAIWDKVVIHFSVISATIPRTNSFWISLQTGKTGTYVTQEEYELSDSRGGSTGMFTERSGSARPKSNIQSNLRSQDNSPLPLVPQAESKVSTRVYATNSESTYDDFRNQAVMGADEDEDSSQSSLKQRGHYGVWRDVGFSVQGEDADTRSRSSTGVAF
ncbi:hypothetical protein H2201_000058 [Coniosporium apollinis]|uniref:Rhodopsin domain-containing protein n=2 Tax=Coniosporium TaxID=2810619 RepID=A0ABQ9P535_9PEZI|nr:hypothetical protein H2199_008297 [Cladosporium sp. JES 115]KAJ9669674.1 hypothetical protein H2201_000058 [Coniosporium apollinis]